MNALSAALEITVFGMLGIFAFMIIFYFSIKAIDKIWPYKKESDN